MLSHPGIPALRQPGGRGPGTIPPRPGGLLRVGPGAYAAPISSRFGKRPPAPAKIVESLAAQSGEAVAPRRTFVSLVELDHRR